MGKRFELKIKLGSDVMQSDLDIAAALRKVADILSQSDDSASNATPGAELIRDVDNNILGHWFVMD